MSRGKSPYIGVELDAVEKCAPAGAACGLSEEQFFMGLGKMWRYCWREKTASLTTLHVRGFFYGTDATASLEAFGFVRAEGGAWTVRGADTWLQVQAARSENGKKAAANGNLRRGPATRKKRGVVPSSAPAVLQQSPNSAPALTASSQQPATNNELQQHAPTRVLSDALVAKYREIRGEAYQFSKDRDGPALPALLKVADIPTIVGRFERGLRLGSTFPGLSTIAELRGPKWNHLSAGPPTPKNAPTDPDQQFPLGELNANPV